MVMPIQSLMNMETMLYGGAGLNSNAPSMLNNYVGRMYSDTASYNSPYSNFGYNPSFTGYQNFGSLGAGAMQPSAGNSVFEGLSNKDEKALINSYAKGLEPSGSLLGSAAGAAGFGVVTKPRIWLHPFSAASSIGKLKETGLFSTLATSGSKLSNLWADAATNNVVREAYGTMHKATQNGNKLFGIFHTKYTESELKAINKLMEDAIAKGDAQSIANATAQIDYAYSKTNTLKKLWGNITGNKSQSVTEALSDTSAKAVTDAASKIAKGTPKTYWETVKSGCGIKGGLFMFGIEMLMNIGKIRTAFSKDGKTGAKQVGQSVFKAAGNTAGWMLGESFGTWACAKAFAKAGSKINPVWGTAIGALAGMVCGMVGCFISGKVTKAIVGEDVANKVEAEKLSQTQDGQIQLLQSAYEKVQKGQADPATVMAVQKVLNSYA